MEGVADSMIRKLWIRKFLGTLVFFAGAWIPTFFLIALNFPIWAIWVMGGFWGWFILSDAMKHVEKWVFKYEKKDKNER
jgi:hypothetical protein